MRGATNRHGSVGDSMFNEPESRFPSLISHLSPATTGHMTGPELHFRSDADSILHPFCIFVAEEAERASVIALGLLVRSSS
jgi:hypothetical protein